MNIKKAKEDIKNTVRAYLKKNRLRTVQYSLYPPASHVINGGLPESAKTQIMQQIAQECNIGLVAYTITQPHQTKCCRTAIY